MAIKLTVGNSNTIVKKIVVGVPTARYALGSTFRLAALNDVTITNPQNGEFLAYDSASENYTLQNFSDDIHTQAIRALFSASGDLSYDSSTGQFTFDVEQVYTKDNFDSDFNVAIDEAALGGTGLRYDDSTNTLHIDSSELASYFLRAVSGSIIPAVDSAYNLGDSNFKWKDLYLSGNTIYLGGVKLQDENSTFVVRDSQNDVVTLSLEANTTDDLAEGSVNEYWTRVRFDTALADILGANIVRGHFRAGTGVTYDSSIGEFSIGQDVATNADVTFNSVQTTGNIIVGGDLTVNGTTTTINSTTLSVNDKNIVLADSAANAAAADGAGITVFAADATITYNASADDWVFNKGVQAPDFEGVYLGFDSDFNAKSTTDLSEGDNLYYTRVRFDSALGDSTSISTIRGYFSAAGDLTYNSSTGEFSFDVEQVYTKANFDSDFNMAIDEATLNGTGLSYDSATNTLSITDTGVVSGTYGSTTQIPVFTVNAQGQIDSISEVLVAGVTSTSFDSSTGVFTIFTADGDSFATHIQDSADLVKIARSSISVVDQGGDGRLLYNPGTGIFTYTGPSAEEVRSHFSAGGDLTYDSATGRFSFDVEQVYTKANFDSDFNVAIDEAALGGTGLTYDSSTNTLSITDTGVVAGTYGSTTQVPVFTVNAQGQIDSVGEVLVAGVTSTTYDSSTGVFTINTADGNSFATTFHDSADHISRARTSLSVTDAGGDGSFSYDNSTGVFTYTGPSSTEVRAHLVAGTGVGYDSAAGVISIGQPVETTSDVTFAKITGDSAIVDGINLNQTPTQYSTTPGALYFDSNELHGLSFVPRTREGATNNVIHLGQQSVIYVHNQTGEVVNRGDVVYISGTAHGSHPKISKAQADGSTIGTVALASTDIADNAHGYVTRFGLVEGLNTGGLVAGDDVYLSKDTAGGWTTTEVSIDSGYPIHIGKIVAVDSTAGTILVDPFTEHFEYLRIEDRLLVTGKIEGDSASISQIDFNTLYAEHIAYKEGSVWYDQIHKTLNYWGDDSNVVHEIGIEEHQRVYNNTGSTITKGQPLYFSGNYNPGGGEVAVPTVGLADATDVNAYNAQGLAAGDIPNNSYGYCLISGQLDGVNTSGLSSSTNFFVGLTPGAVQNASPTYPNYPMCLGWVVRADSADGVLLVNQQNHSVNSFRVRTSAHIGDDLTVEGNLIVNGTQTITSTENVQIGGNIQYLNAGNTIGEANTVFVGGGLDDAFFAGHYSGDSSTKYFYVKIDSSGPVDTFEWGHDSTVGPVATGITITGAEQTLTAGISIDFGATTGHTTGDKWTGTATATDTDTGFFSNRNTGDAGDGYTHIGLFFDVSENKWRLLDAYDSEPEAPIDITSPSLSYGTLVVDTVEGNLTGDVTGNADTATQLANNRAFSITGDITAAGVNFNGTGDVALSATITAGSIVNDDINATAAIADTKLATISTAGKVQNSATTATSANTASAIVARDASGNFSAGTITATFSGNLTGNVTGNADTATAADSAYHALSADLATNADSATTAASALFATNAGQLNGQADSYYLNYNNLTNTPTNVSSFINDANYLDSTTVFTAIDSIGAIPAVNVVGALAPTDGQSLTWDNANGYWKPVTVSTDAVDSVSNATNSLLLDSQYGSYYLDYSNFTNKPSVSTFTNDAGYLDSSTVIGAIDDRTENGHLEFIGQCTSSSNKWVKVLDVTLNGGEAISAKIETNSRIYNTSAGSNPNYGELLLSIYYTGSSFSHSISYLPYDIESSNITTNSFILTRNNSTGQFALWFQAPANQYAWWGRVINLVTPTSSGGTYDYISCPPLELGNTFQSTYTNLQFAYYAEYRDAQFENVTAQFIEPTTYLNLGDNVELYLGTSTSSDVTHRFEGSNYVTNFGSGTNGIWNLENGTLGSGTQSITFDTSNGTITATTFSGTASVATSVTATANNTTNETTYITFVDGTTGTQGIETDTGLTYNPSTNTITASIFSGSLSGNATSADSATNAANAVNADQLDNQAPSYYLNYNNFTNTPIYADSAYVTAQIDALIGGAPGTLDTLNEIAAALNDDDSAYATLVDLINAQLDSSEVIDLIDSAYVQLRQDYAYSSLTGTPTTVSTFTNDANYLDSTTVEGVIDATYIQANQKLGLTYFADSSDSASPNNIVPISILNAIANDSSADIAIRPKGVGAITRDVPDGTTAGGDKRGEYAVDFSVGLGYLARSASTQVASGDYSFATGVRVTASGSYSFASGYNNTASGGYSFVGGVSSQATNGYAFAFGNGAQATGQGSTALGTISTASGAYSFVNGYSNTASGQYSQALGYSNSATNTSSIAIGSGNSSTGSYSVALGDATSTSTGSFAAGYRARADGWGSTALGNGDTRSRNFSFALGSIGISGDGNSQASMMSIARETTDATPTLLSAYSALTSAAYQFSQNDANSAAAFKILVVGAVTGAGATKIWEISGGVKRGSSYSSTTLVGSVVKNVIAADTGTSSWDVDVTANTSVGGISITVTGAAGTTIRWAAKIDASEVRF